MGRPFVPNIDQPTEKDNQNEPYVPFFRYLLGQKHLPAVISTSYGDEEDVSSITSFLI
jgi:tripeptidyl-peptidase-1